MNGSAISTGATDAFVCVVSGTVGGLIIGLVTEYYTSFSYAPVREVSGETPPWLDFFQEGWLGLARLRLGRLQSPWLGLEC